jgi:hypothetical protein
MDQEMDSAAGRQSPIWHPVNGGTYCANAAILSLPITNTVDFD